MTLEIVFENSLVGSGKKCFNWVDDPVKTLLLGTVLFCGLLLAAETASTQTWTQTSAPIKYWTGIACSADGTKCVASADGIYVSTNSGTSWMRTSAPTSSVDGVYGWYSLASSADGTTLIAGVSGGTNAAYISRDSGRTWRPSGSPLGGQDAVAASADGTTLIEVCRDLGAAYGEIWCSTNSGTSWTMVTPTNTWFAAASSADGSHLVAVANFGGGSNPGGIWTSTNSGVSWVSNAVPNEAWRTVASSADAKRLVAGAWFYSSGGIFISTNSGTDWKMTGAPVDDWQAIASSADSSRLAAAVNGGGIWISTNSGVDWAETDAPITNWSAIASSADGSRLIASVNGGGIWTTKTTSAPQINIEPTNGNLILSWLIPSTNFVLQENPGLRRRIG